jgi:hypothetical protein
MRYPGLDDGVRSVGGLSEKVGRRGRLRTLGVGATVAAAAAAPLSGDGRADTETNDEKRKARYQVDSPHVQTLYRVNRYAAK